MKTCEIYSKLVSFKYDIVLCWIWESLCLFVIEGFMNTSEFLDLWSKNDSFYFEVKR